MGIFGIVILAAFLTLFFPARADAYLDPGTGSYLIQLLLAALLGATVTLRIYWKKVKTLLHRDSPPSDDKRPE